MNIFVLDKDPSLCAQYHCDKHVIKMILESAQILSTVIQEHWGHGRVEQLYKPTHKNHPCVLWARSPENFYWLYKLGKQLAKEYTHRYGKKHKSETILDLVGQYINKNFFEHAPVYSFVLTMPDEYKKSDPVRSYREYYKKDKQHLLTYTNRTKPEWIYEY